MSARRRHSKSKRSRQPLTTGALLLLLVFLGLSYLIEQGVFDRWLRPQPAVVTPAVPKGGPSGPLAAPEATETEALVGFANWPVQVYFTRPRYPESARTREGGLDETVAADIDRALRSVELAAYDLDLPNLADALMRAVGRDVAVRLVIDAENLETPEVARITGEMQQAGVSITFDRRSALMHNKFVVIDGEVTWTGSWNPTVNDTFRNDNNMLRIDDARVAENYVRKFDVLFDGQGGPQAVADLPNPVVELGAYRLQTSFSPQDDITGQVVQALEQAQSSVDFLAFTFTSDPIAEAVLAARDRGLRVRGVIEGRNARASGSELARLQRDGVDVLVDGNCYIMHHKVFVIDSRTVITGSFNWTRQAQEANDENSVLVDNPWLAQRYAEEFDRVYNQAREPTRCSS